jgi:L-threonylcarbamoyladenylate synthase
MNINAKRLINKKGWGMTKRADQAVEIIKSGGVILYPTEGVYGLGCDPFNEKAVLRVLKMKQRDISQGLILIAANWDQVKDLIDMDLESFSFSTTRNNLPTTWLLPATKKVPAWILGRFKSVAIRVTQHPGSKEICKKFGSPIVSTSANISKKSPPKHIEDIDEKIVSGVDYVVGGETGNLGKPTKICDIKTGKIIRF